MAHSFLVFFFVVVVLFLFSNQLCTLGFYVTFNVVKLMFNAFFFIYFMFVNMVVFNACVNDTVQLL